MKNVMYESGNIERASMTRTRYYGALAWCLILFAFTMPLSKSAGNILLFLIYPVVSAGVLLYKDVRDLLIANLKQPLTLAFLLVFLVSFIGIFFSEQYADGIHTANKFLSLPAIYLMVAVLIQVLRDKSNKYGRPETILMAFLIGLMILNIIGAMTYLGIVGHKRFVLPLSPLHVHHIWFSNLNAIGLYAAAAFLLYSWRDLARGSKTFLYISIALAVLCILLSTSRTAWFGILLTSMTMAFLVSKSRKVFFMSAGVAAAICLSAYLFIPFVQERIHMIGSDISTYSAGESVTSSLAARFLMWKAALLMFMSNPLTGVGTGDYVPTMAAYVNSGQFPNFLLEFNQPHNMYLFALATNGLPGLIALLYVFYRILKFALPAIHQSGGDRSRGNERLFAFLAAATAVHFLIAGLTDSFFSIQILRYSFALVMGVSVRQSSASNQST
jgi:O-antigen ligase